jgi:hypothetical protein
VSEVTAGAPAPRRLDISRCWVPYSNSNDALYVEFFDRLGVPVHLRERELLAQFVPLTFVTRQIDDLGE